MIEKLTEQKSNLEKLLEEERKNSKDESMRAEKALAKQTELTKQQKKRADELDKLNNDLLAKNKELEKKKKMQPAGRDAGDSNLLFPQYVVWRKDGRYKIDLPSDKLQYSKLSVLDKQNNFFDLKNEKNKATIAVKKQQRVFFPVLTISLELANDGKEAAVRLEGTPPNVKFMTNFEPFWTHLHNDIEVVLTAVNEDKKEIEKRYRLKATVVE
jgi:hypothetical protein